MGAGLLANAVCQPMNTRLKDRFREQARSHIGLAVFLRAVIRFRA
ncbi:hypothetical protein AK972_4962 [Pseudomonas yamanorum]|nr:hypothetical protein AK972_4962 [Pseudomonas yamanorum]